MNPWLWIFAGISLVLALGIFLFLYYCKSNIFAKSISTILVILTGVGGSKFTPGYKGNFRINSSVLSFDGYIDVGGASTDSTILICVLGVTLVVLICCVTFLKYKGKLI
jgi:hypothetical protein